MRLKKIHMKNFRAFHDCEVEFDDYTVLVGANGAGKSTILYALNILFRETENSNTDVSLLSEEDFHNRNTSMPIEITVTFGDLSTAAQETFAEYVRQGLLIITAKATFDEDTGAANVEQFGQRMVMDEFKNYFERDNDGASASELKTIYKEIRESFPDLPKVTVKADMRNALRDYEANHPEKCVLVPSKDQFYGFSRGSNRLAEHIQWVYIPAIKDATEEQVEAKNTALGKILSRTVRAKVKFDDAIKDLQKETLDRYREILGAQQSALDDISKSLSKRLGQWAHPNATARVEWSEDEKKSVQVQDPSARIVASEGSFEGDLARFGHGLQRSYLLALLQELASVDDVDAPKLILGCEEPELYQHPPQSRHLASVLQGLSQRNSQIIVTTHSPYFVSGKYFDNVRRVFKNTKKNCSEVFRVFSDDVALRVAEVTGEDQKTTDIQQVNMHQALQPSLNEMFFTSKLILVEGLEDVAYITSWMFLTNRWEKFRRSGCHVVPVNGKSSLIEVLIIAQKLEIPVFVIFDADSNMKEKEYHRKHHERDNKALLTLLGEDASNCFPNTTIWSENCAVWSHNIGDTIKNEVTEPVWDKTLNQVARSLGLATPDKSLKKKTMHIGEHLNVLKSEVDIPCLDKLCDQILAFGISSGVWASSE